MTLDWRDCSMDGPMRSTHAIRSSPERPVSPSRRDSDSASAKLLQMRRGVAGVAAFIAFGLLGVPAAAAPPPGVHPAPRWPAGKPYAVPVEVARTQAHGGHGQLP